MEELENKYDTINIITSINESKEYFTNWMILFLTEFKNFYLYFVYLYIRIKNKNKKIIISQLIIFLIYKRNI